MKFDLSIPFLKIDGSQQTNTNTKKPITFQEVLFECVGNTYQGDEGLSADKKLARYRLKQKIATEGSVKDLSAEEQVMIKECALKGLLIDAFGQVHDFLEKPLLSQA